MNNINIEAEVKIHEEKYLRMSVFISFFKKKEVCKINLKAGEQKDCHDSNANKILLSIFF